MAETTYSYRYPHPAVTVDCAVFSLDRAELRVLLIQRGGEPFRGAWALPGGFVEIDEDLHAAAARELQEETGVRGIFLEQLGAFGRPDRDPRERVISVAFYAVGRFSAQEMKADDDAADADWFAMDSLPRLAFDHSEILRAAHQRLKEKLFRSDLLFQILPDTFTLLQVKQFCETILSSTVDEETLHRKLVASGILAPVAETGGSAGYYRFDRVAYEAAKALDAFLP